MVHAKCALDHLLFELVEVERLAGNGERRCRARGEGKVLDPIRLSLGHDDRPLGRVPQRTHVAGPIMPHERVQHDLRKGAFRLVVFARIKPEIMVEKDRHVLAPFAQRRKRDLNRVQAEQKILAEALLVCELVGRHVRCSNHANVDRNRFVGADRHDLALFERRQELGLEVQR